MLYLNNPHIPLYYSPPPTTTSSSASECSRTSSTLPPASESQPETSRLPRARPLCLSPSSRTGIRISSAAWNKIQTSGSTEDTRTMEDSPPKVVDITSKVLYVYSFCNYGLLFIGWTFAGCDPLFPILVCVCAVLVYL